MRNWINRHPYVVAVLLVCLVSLFVAARPRGVSRTTSLWVGGDTDTTTNITVDSYNGTYHAYIKGDLEVDGTIYADGGNLTGATTTRDLFFDLAGAHVDGGNDVDDASAPNITTLDNIPAILWDDSSETAGVQWTFRVPSDYSTGLTFYAMVSSNDASGAGTKLDWALIQNRDDTGFASVTAQDLVECTSATLDASNEVLTLTPDATGAALFTSGSIITLELFNASTNDDDLELKAVWGTYTAIQ